MNIYIYIFYTYLLIFPIIFIFILTRTTPLVGSRFQEASHPHTHLPAHHLLASHTQRKPTSNAIQPAKQTNQQSKPTCKPNQPATQSNQQRKLTSNANQPNANRLDVSLARVILRFANVNVRIPKGTPRFIWWETWRKRANVDARIAMELPIFIREET